jgi:hypothetical protein
VLLPHGKIGHPAAVQHVIPFRFPDETKRGTIGAWQDLFGSIRSSFSLSTDGARLGTRMGHCSFPVRCRFIPAHSLSHIRNVGHALACPAGGSLDNAASA